MPVTSRVGLAPASRGRCPSPQSPARPSSPGAGAGPSPAGARPDSFSPGRARHLRGQSIRYENLANRGVYADVRSVVAHGGNLDLTPRPLVFAEVPLTDPGQARLFHRAGDAVGDALEDKLITPPRSGAPGLAHLPVHWEEKRTLEESFPNLRFVQDGEVYRGASPRSLFIGTDPDQIPARYPELEHLSLKMHLSKSTYARMRGLGGNRDINANDAFMATVLSHLMEELRPVLSPYFDYQPEARAMAVRIGAGEEATEVGMIFRDLGDRALIPGFALFSPTAEPLPHAPLRAVDLRASEARTEGRASAAREGKKVLAFEAMQLAMARNPELGLEEAFLRLFVDPLADVMFSLARQGLSAEIHPQNFLLEFDPRTGDVAKVVLRDLHGLGCDDAWRLDHGLEPLLTPGHLRSAFPDIRQADLDGYLKRDGVIRDRYLAPRMFRKMIDFFGGMFFLQLLSALHEAGHLSTTEVDALVERIKDRLEDAARAHGFDLASVEDPRVPHVSFWNAQESDIRSKAVFRRAPEKRARDAGTDELDTAGRRARAA